MKNLAYLFVVVAVTMTSAVALADDMPVGGPIGAPPLAPPFEASGSQTILTGVPSYIWYYGCGPTALGMIIGYWDGQGYELIPGSNDWDTNQQAIKDVIASSGHIADYWPTPDNPPPYHDDDCLADFCECSRDPLGPGSSYFSDQHHGLKDYATHCGYTSGRYCFGYYLTWGNVWDAFVDNIDLGRPVEFLVDIDGNNTTDHFVTAIGYDDTPGEEKYYCWDTWSHTIREEPFQVMGSGKEWGVYGATFFHMVPEPSTFMMLGGVAVCLLLWPARRRLKRRTRVPPTS